MDGTPAPEPELDLDYQLADNLTRTSGRIFLTGTQRWCALCSPSAGATASAA